jgi:hypothetical protein
MFAADMCKEEWNTYQSGIPRREYRCENSAQNKYFQFLFYGKTKSSVMIRKLLLQMFYTVA